MFTHIFEYFKSSGFKLSDYELLNRAINSANMDIFTPVFEYYQTFKGKRPQTYILENAIKTNNVETAIFLTIKIGCNLKGNLRFFYTFEGVR